MNSWLGRDFTKVVSEEECSIEIGQPGEPVTLRHILRLHLLLVREINASQRALVVSGLRGAAAPHAVRRAEVLERAHLLVAEWAPYSRPIKEMIGRMKSRGVVE